MYVWNVEAAAFETKLDLDNNFTLALAATDRELFVGHGSKITVLDSRTLEPLKSFSLHMAMITSILTSRDGRVILAGSLRSGLAWLTIEGVHTLKQFEGRTPFALSASGAHVVYCYKPAKLQLWSADQHEQREPFDTPEIVHALAISDDGRTIYVGDSDGILSIWTEAKLLCELEGHKEPIYGMLLSEDNQTLATYGTDGIILWDVMRRSPRAQIPCPLHHPNCIAGTSDLETVLTGGYDHQVRLWHFDSVASRSYLREQQLMADVAWNNSLGLGVTACVDGLITLIDPVTGETGRVIGRHPAGATCVDISRDGSIVASGGDDDMVRLWEVRGGQIAALEHYEWIKKICILPDCRTLVSATKDGSISIWDLAHKRLVRRLSAFEGEIEDIASNGAFLVMIRERIEVWNMREWSLVRTFGEAQGAFYSIDIDTDGHMIVTGGTDGTITIWDVYTGTAQKQLRGHTALVEDVRITPDGTRIISQGTDDTVRVWSIEQGRCLAIWYGQARFIVSCDNNSSFRTWDDDGVLNVWEIYGSSNQGGEDAQTAH